MNQEIASLRSQRRMNQEIASLRLLPWMACMQKMQRSDVSEHFSAAKTGGLLTTRSMPARVWSLIK
jgi:hypothetical protein